MFKGKKDKAKPLGPQGGNNAERTVLRVNRDWCAALPPEAVGGSFDVPADHDRFGDRYDVPDGVYRVQGSDWLFTFSKGRLVNGSRATPANEFGGPAVKIVSTQWLT